MKKHRRKVYAAHILVPAGLAAITILLMGTLFYEQMQEVFASVNVAVQSNSPNHFYTETVILAQKEQTQVETIQPQAVGKVAIGQSYGWISSEDFALDAYIYYGDDDKTLDQGVGQYTDSGLPGYGKTILLCGHDTTFFKGLEDAAIGDLVNIRTQYGNYSYRITETKVTTADDAAAARLEEEDEQLVLYTCYPFGETDKERKQRYFVYCEKVSGPQVQTSQAEES
ncbi:MAG: class D sortase [Lachnospiraceae bacterium]|nr:class D sortase [Lachnospiraceae bacterium]